MKQYLSAQDNFAALLQPITEFNRALSPMTSTLNRINDAFEPLYRFSEQLSKQPELLERAVHCLAQSGWYIDAEMTISEPQMLARKVSAEKGEASIANYYRQRADSIENELLEKYPHRKSILLDAFSAHRAGKYNLSIPALLSQADGIWYDKFSKDLFREGPRQQASNEYAERLQNSFLESIFSIFSETTPLWISERKRDPEFSGLNRHQIVHGEVVNFGNENNSLMCISFIGFLCWILNCDEEDEEQDAS